MADAETSRSDGIEAAAIVTPNHRHHPPAKAFLEAGIDVICDKPLTTTLADALDLAELVKRTGLVFGLTHNYTGHPMVRQAREMVTAGEFFFQAEDGIRYHCVTGVQTCALPI